MDLIEKLNAVLATTYALYLKTQNYHWNVCGKCFFQLHNLFEVQYREMASAIDEIAEIIRILGEKVPASFDIFVANSVIEAGDESLDYVSMIQDLCESNKLMIKLLEETLNIAQETGKEEVADLVIRRMGVHNKGIWMLTATLAR